MIESSAIEAGSVWSKSFFAFSYWFVKSLCELLMLATSCWLLSGTLGRIFEVSWVIADLFHWGLAIKSALKRLPSAVSFSCYPVSPSL